MVEIEGKAGEQSRQRHVVVEALAWSSSRFQAAPKTTRETLLPLHVDLQTTPNFAASVHKKSRQDAAYEQIVVVDLLMVFLEAYIAKNPLLPERASRHMARFFRSIGQDWDAFRAERAATCRVSPSEAELRSRHEERSYAAVLPILGIAPEELSEAHALTVVLHQARIQRFGLTQLVQHLQRARPTLTRNQVSHFLRTRVRIEQGLNQPTQVARTEWPQEKRLEWLTRTTDFLANPRALAVHGKYAKDLSVERKRKSRKIEEEYWRQRGVGFTVLTEREIKKTETDVNAAGEKDHG